MGERNTERTYKRKIMLKRTACEVVLAISIVLMLVPFLGILYLSVNQMPRFWRGT